MILAVQPRAISHRLTRMYRRKQNIEDVTSTAYTFTIVSVAGFILLTLFGLDLLPFHSASYTKTLILIVMGVMFAIFFFVGIKSFYGIKKRFQMQLIVKKSSLKRSATGF